MGNRKNELIEKILSNDKLVEYLDSEDWINFWLGIKMLYGGGVYRDGMAISENDLKEFSEIVPDAFKSIEIFKPNTDTYIVWSDAICSWLELDNVFPEIKIDISSDDFADSFIYFKTKKAALNCCTHSLPNVKKGAINIDISVSSYRNSAYMKLKKDRTHTYLYLFDIE